MGFIESILARIRAPKAKPGEEATVIPPLPWRVQTEVGETVSVVAQTAAREENGVLTKETLAQTVVGQVPEGVETPAIAQARGVQQSREGVVVFEDNSAFSRIEDYGASAHGTAGTPPAKP